MSKDANYNKMIQSKRWLMLRKRKINADPLCEDCKAAGYYTPATEVHHVVPCETATSVEGMARLMFDYNNLRSLCHDCHVLAHKSMRSHSKEAQQRNVESAVKRFKERWL